MNLMYGTELAVFQDNLILKYKSKLKISEHERVLLTTNKWIPMAEKLAPNNLVIRQFILIDLFNNNTNNYDRIAQQIKLLSSYKNSNNLLWAEGYSYWRYTKEFLVEYSLKFNLFNDIIAQIDNNFNLCGYSYNNLTYPAPFGDLRDEICNANKTDLDNITIANVIKVTDNNTVIYTINPWPVGLNCHTPKKKTIIRINNGVPENFKFYEGYNKKYNSNMSELKDMLSLSRVISLFK